MLSNAHTSAHPYSVEDALPSVPVHSEYVIDLKKTDEVLLAELLAHGLDEELAKVAIAAARNEKPPDRIDVGRCPVCGRPQLVGELRDPHRIPGQIPPRESYGLWFRCENGHEWPEPLTN